MRLLRRGILFIAVSLLVLGIALGASGLILRARVNQGLAATRRLQAAVERRDFRQACAEMQVAAAAWNGAAAISTPLAPLLVRLDWLPRIGPDVRLAPTALVLAQNGTGAGARACGIAAPALAAESLPEQLALAAERLSADPAQLDAILAHLSRAHAAAQALGPELDTSPRLAPYRDQLSALTPALGRAVQTLQALRDGVPALDWLLGLRGSRRYMVVLQNPFELRPTGGFMGLVCVLEVARAKPTIEECRTSEAYTAPAPPSMPMPDPYNLYLRLGNYYLRDANWSPDFPTTAARLQEFWKLNGQAPVDGVIGIDIYALKPLVEVTGPLVLEDGTEISSDNVIDAILARYYDGRVRRDKQGISTILPSLLQRLITGGPAKLPRLAGALQTIAAERHLLVNTNNQTINRVLTRQGWDGGMYPFDGVYLKVIDTDVGYGGVNAFVERLTDYQVALGPQGTPTTATLTLTYTNRYSPWAEAPTSHAVYGKCADPATAELQRSPGCYANYVRIYVGAGSQLLNLEGLERTPGADQRYGMAVFGGYFRVFPGEQRVVRLRYRLPAATTPAVLVEKQPGSETLPLHVRLVGSEQGTEYWGWGRQDIYLPYELSSSVPRLLARSEDGAVEPFRRNVAFHRGLLQWQAGDREAAAGSWQTGDAWDLVLDHARYLQGNGGQQDALGLTQLALAHGGSGRAAYERAVLLEAAGDQGGAGALYARAAEDAPDHPLARLTYVRFLAATGQPLPPLDDRKISAAATRRWSDEAADIQQAGQLDTAIAYWQALHHFEPENGELALRIGDLLARTGRTEEAFAHYTRLGQTSEVWGRIAVASAAAISGQSAEAVRLYRDALPFAQAYDSAYRIGEGLDELEAVEDARHAFEQAAALDPNSIWPLLAIGDLLRYSDPAAARGWYDRARALDPQTGYPTSGYPDFAIGSLLVDQGQLSAALPFLETAVAKEPEVAMFRDLLEQVRARAQASS